MFKSPKKLISFFIHVTSHFIHYHILLRSSLIELEIGLIGFGVGLRINNAGAPSWPGYPALFLSNQGPLPGEGVTPSQHPWLRTVGAVSFNTKRTNNHELSQGRTKGHSQFSPSVNVRATTTAYCNPATELRSGS